MKILLLTLTLIIAFAALSPAAGPLSGDIDLDRGHIQDLVNSFLSLPVTDTDTRQKQLPELLTWLEAFNQRYPSDLAGWLVRGVIAHNTDDALHGPQIGARLRFMKESAPEADRTRITALLQLLNAKGWLSAQALAASQSVPDNLAAATKATAAKDWKAASAAAKTVLSVDPSNQTARGLLEDANRGILAQIEDENKARKLNAEIATLEASLPGLQAADKLSNDRAEAANRAWGEAEKIWGAEVDKKGYATAKTIDPKEAAAANYSKYADIALKARKELQEVQSAIKRNRRDLDDVLKTLPPAVAAEFSTTAKVPDSPAVNDTSSAPPKPSAADGTSAHATPTAPAMVPKKPQAYKVTGVSGDDPLVVRLKPDGESARVGTLNNGDKPVHITGDVVLSPSGYDWVPISFGQFKGYVRPKYLTPEQE